MNSPSLEDCSAAGDHLRGARVEKEPGDQDGKARRLKVPVSRIGSTVRAREVFDVRTYEDRDWAARLALGARFAGPRGLTLRLIDTCVAAMSDRIDTLSRPSTWPPAC